MSYIFHRKVTDLTESPNSIRYTSELYRTSRRKHRSGTVAILKLNQCQLVSQWRSRWRETKAAGATKELGRIKRADKRSPNTASWRNNTGALWTSRPPLGQKPQDPRMASRDAATVTRAQKPAEPRPRAGDAVGASVDENASGGNELRIQVHRLSYWIENRSNTKSEGKISHFYTVQKNGADTR